MKKHKNLFIVLAIILVASVSIVIIAKEKNNDIYKENENIKKTHSNGIAMMLETEAGSGNYEMTTRDTWPTDGYVFNSNLSKCENGGELSWDDENKRVLMSGTVSDKCYVYFDIYKPKTLTDYVKALYTGTQGENNIYYHDADLANGAGDNSYRYAGASETVNNFVCFGSTESPCPTDNLYRIIGVFRDQVKLIKYDYATSALLGTDGDYFNKYPYGNSTYEGNNYESIVSYYWNYKQNTTLNNGHGSNTWSTSLLNTTNLNKNYITNIGTEWAKKIATTTWKVGGNRYANIATSAMNVAYQNEITNAVATGTTDGATEYSAKIGLMYISDYGFAASPTYWTYVGYNSSDSTKDYRAATTSNWMYMGLSEWSISRIADGSYIVFSILNTGFIDHLETNEHIAVRPTFSLLSSTNYVSGSGSSSDPIIID